MANETGIVSPAYTILRCKKTHSSLFYDAYFHTDEFINHNLSKAVEGIRDGRQISYAAFKWLGIPYCDPCEQKKISDLLAILNKRIAKQSDLVESLKKYKRGVVKNLLTKKITIVKNTEKWKKHKLGELITLQSGQDFSPSDYNDDEEGIPYMTGASCIVNGKTVVSRWTPSPRCFAYYGDTLLVCKGSGSGAVVMLSQEKVHIARQFMALRPHETMTKEFCFYLTLHLSEKIKQAATGLIEGIDRKTVLNQDVYLPSIAEQKQIVMVLFRIDKKLFAEEKCLEKLVSMKKGLMQHLFI